MKLWLRVALVVAAVSTAALLLTGGVAIFVAGDAARTAALRAQERDAAAVAATVDRWLSDQRANLEGWAGVFPVASLDAEHQAGITSAVLGAMPSTVVVVLVDGDGQPLVPPVWLEDAPPGSIAGSAEGAERLLRRLPLAEVLANGAALGEPALDSGIPTVPLAVVASEDPPIVLAVELAIDVVRELREQTTPDHAIVLVDRHGHVMAGQDHPLLEVDRFLPLLGTHASLAFEVDQLEVQGAMAPVGLTGWSGLVLEPSAVALEGPRRIRRLLPVVTGAAILLAVVLGLFLGRTVTEPIARLRDSALALAEGRLGVTTDVLRSDEVGELARAFNHMSVRLRENQQEIRLQREAIESFNQDLQREVDEATRDLREAQEQLVRSGQLAAVAQIGAGLAHELNNPLTAVLGLTQILRSRAVPPGLEDDLRMLESEALRCREVVDALLKLADGGRATAEGDADLRAIVEDVTQAVGPIFADRSVRLVTDAVPDLRVAIGLGPATQALSQLLSGLAAGLPAGATLTVRARKAGTGAMLELVPSHPVELASDDWMASGIDVWVARQTLDRLGAALVEPIDDEAPWQVRLECV